ncbi:hypothetical protein [Halocatena pleomorpha]|uniref:Uncharacterized protein n=1 Tax=Halocatena pleomorpha TaxID=1785090 RepID=A0A3P3R4U6_9EURY|nr:hypothetical protein [Halocatena pleomorpha]RRJ28516.1 hypothetical protein EIK79_15595 [Halocatena pleomorpha]
MEESEDIINKIMNRIQKLILMVLLVLSGSIAGCLTTTPTTGNTDTPTAGETRPNNSMANKSGPIQANVVADPPSSAIIISSNDDRLDDVKPIQKVVEKAIAKDATRGKAGIRLEDEQFTRTDESLKKLPIYNETLGEAGHYIRHDGTVVRVNLLLEQ